MPLKSDKTSGALLESMTDAHFRNEFEISQYKFREEISNQFLNL